MTYVQIKNADDALLQKFRMLRAAAGSMHALSMKTGISESTLYSMQRNIGNIHIANIRKLVPWFRHYKIPIDMNEVIGC